MATYFHFDFEKPTRAIYISAAEKSAARLENGTFAQEKYSGTFGMEDHDFKRIVPLMIEAIKAENGSFSGNLADYRLPCTSSKAAAEAEIRKAEFKSRKLPADEAFKLKEKAEKLAEIYSQYAGILKCSTAFDVELCKLEYGKVVDLWTKDMGPCVDLKKTLAREMFYRGAWIIPKIRLKGTSRKTPEEKDGCTAYLDNCMFLKHGERLGGAGAGPGNQSVFGSWAGYSDVDPTALAPGGAEQEPAEAAW